MRDPVLTVAEADAQLEAILLAAAELIISMDEGERLRFDAGRDDWPTGKWQDHCGREGCDMSSCRDSIIPQGRYLVIASRRALVARLEREGVMDRARRQQVPA
jgi:hypothetical protein